MALDKEKITDMVWNDDLHSNTKLFLLAAIYVSDSFGRFDTSKLSKIRTMTKLESDEAWSQAILDSVYANYILMDSHDSGKHLYYAVRLRNV